LLFEGLIAENKIAFPQFLADSLAMEVVVHLIPKIAIGNQGEVVLDDEQEHDIKKDLVFGLPHCLYNDLQLSDFEELKHVERKKEGVDDEPDDVGQDVG
jgi:hypothetical protein